MTDSYPIIEWVTIPPNQITLVRSEPYPQQHIKTTIEHHIPSFRISKYPITHAQYLRFIQAGGYDEPRWWLEAGWLAKSKGYDDVFVSESERESSLQWMPTGKAWKKPRFWDDTHPDTPVTGVSWYEAMAYCAWLGHILNDEMTLPTDPQYSCIGLSDREMWYWSNTTWQTDDIYILRTGAHPFWADWRGNSPIARDKSVGFYIVQNTSLFP